ncbi:DUF4231 domain-containing protein [Nonomuraea wenchangensis]
MSAFIPSSADIPSLYRAAQAASRGGQKRFLRAIRLRLTLLVLAAVMSAATWRVAGIELLAILSVIAFGGALIAGTYLALARPEKAWYEGRAVAESVKSLMWRYMAGGATFSVGGPNSDLTVEKLFVHRCQEVIQSCPELDLTPTEGSADEVTQHMTYVRSLPFIERREHYIRGRLEEQIKWYGQRSRFNRRSALAWMAGLLGLEFAGLVAAILRATGLFSIDILGIISAVAAGGIAWVQAKRYQALAAAYAVSYHELAMVRIGASSAVGEEAWESYVDAVEDAILRENNLWGASRPGV